MCPMAIKLVPRPLYSMENPWQAWFMALEDMEVR